ncbi:MAG: HD domain-containing phosphohydrolase [Rhodospirillaceae bacterium]
MYVPRNISFATLLDRLPNVVYIAAADENGATVFVNAAVERVFGYTREEWLGDRTLWINSVHPDDIDHVKDAFLNVRLGGKPAVYEYRIYRRDGRLIWVRDDVQLLLSPEFREPMYWGSVTDITAEKEAALTLAREEKRFRTLFKANPHPMWIFDRETLRFLDVNDAAISQYGYSQAEFAAITIRDIRPPEDVPRLEAEITARPDGFRAPAIWRHRKRDGTEIQVRVVSHSIDFNGRKAVAVLASDITEIITARNELAAQLHHNQKIVRGVITALSDVLDLRDPYTSRHQHRVAEICTAIGARLGWDAARLECLHWAAQLHDLGKISIPTDILNKPGKLSKTEFALIKEHPDAGYRVLANVDLPPVVAAAAYQHHERMDGSGYPRGLKGDEIILEARIIAVADVLESMTLHRPYRAARGTAEAFDELTRNAGTKYDAAIVQIAQELFADGKLAMLSNGGTAIS